MMESTFSDLHRLRYGTAADAASGALPVNERLGGIIGRRTIRQFEERPIPDELMTQLLAAAQSGPTKSDLQQYSIIIVDDPDRRKAIADWIETMPFIVSASAFLVFCGDIRRNRKLCQADGRPHDNDNLDSFFNATVDGSVAMQSFILGAEGAGLCCVPVSYIRKHGPKMAELLSIPEGVFPIAGVAVGYPVWEGKPSIRLPQDVVVHRNSYDDSAMSALVADYDARRHEIDPNDAAKQRNANVYGVSDVCPWSEQISRQLSLPERPYFRQFIEAQGFSLK